MTVQQFSVLQRLREYSLEIAREQHLAIMTVMERYSLLIAGMDGEHICGRTHPVAFHLPLICQVSVLPNGPTLLLAWLQSCSLFGEKLLYPF